MKTQIASTSDSDGLLRFQLPLIELQTLIKKGKNQKGKGTYFFENGARNILFKLEALSRIYKSISTKKSFEPWLEDFKLAEDLLGVVDFFDAFLKEFSTIKGVPTSFLRYFKKGKEEALKNLNEHIFKPDFILNLQKTDEILLALSNLKWPERTEERKAVILFIAEQIDKFVNRYEHGELHFNDIENGVHEFRRKLRWISIYAQSLNGLIQLKKATEIPEILKVYLSNEIVNSPFNKMPVLPKGVKPVLIQSPYFYALSWIIKESGTLKDQGLKILTINEAIKQCDLKSNNAISELKNLLIPKINSSHNAISSKMELIADNFIYRDRILSLLKRDILRNLY